MKIGFAIPASLGFAEQFRIADLCDEAGLSIWMPDERFQRDVFVNLAALAGRTSRSTLGTGVTDPQIRHPLLTAAALATVNDLSEGRAVLGLGAGISGFDALGIKRQSPATGLRDMIGIVRRFWAGEAIDFDGKLFCARNAHLDFKASRAPIYVAGRGPQVLAVGGELAEGVIIGHFTSEPGLRSSLTHIERGIAKRQGTPPPELALWAYTSISRDGRAARDAVKPAIGRSIRSTPAMLDLFGMALPQLMADLDRFGYSRSPEYDRAVRASVPDELTGHLSISGTPDECLERIRSIAAAGIGHVILLPYPAAGSSAAEMIDLVSAELLPRLRAN